MASMPVLAVGSVALDDIETPAGHRPECLGGSATYFSVSASLFAPVRLVAVVGDDFPEEHVTSLRERGVDLGGLERVPGRTFRWKGRYPEESADAITLDTQLNVFEHFEPKVPDAYRETPIVFLGNIHPALQFDVLDQISTPQLVGADTMNFWISGEREALVRVVERLDLLVINETEAKLLAGERNVYVAADKIRAMGPKILVVKRGAYGALLFHPEGLFSCPAVPLRSVVDPTGAGDTFASGMIGALAETGDFGFASFRRAVQAGTVMASFACEGFSLDRVLSVTREEFSARLEQLRASARVE